MSETRCGGLTVEDLAPIYVLTFREGWRPEDFRGVQRLIVAGGLRRLVIISEVLHVRPAGALERRALAATLKELEFTLDPRVIVSIVVTDSAVMRGVVRAVSWVNPVPYAILTVPTMGEAIDLAETHLGSEGVPVPESVRPALARRRLRAVGT